MKRSDMHWAFQYGELLESGMFQVLYDMNADVARSDLRATYIMGGEL